MVSPQEHVNRDREAEMAISAERRRKALMTESGEVRWDSAIDGANIYV